MAIDTLPSRDEDTILTLYAHYYLSAELMHTNYKKLLLRWEQKGKLSRNDGLNYRIYLATWLGYLGVTAEGFREAASAEAIKRTRPAEFSEFLPQCEALEAMLIEHDTELRRFRNRVFHLRKSADLQVEFLTSPGRLEWADSLQQSFGDFFSAYRILCEVRYALQSEPQPNGPH